MTGYLEYYIELYKSLEILCIHTCIYPYTHTYLFIQSLLLLLLIPLNLVLAGTVFKMSILCISGRKYEMADKCAGGEHGISVFFIQANSDNDILLLFLGPTLFHPGYRYPITSVTNPAHSGNDVLK